MKLTTICNLQDNNIESGIYDLAIFSSGYESRCTYVPGRIPKQNVTSVIVLGFDTLLKSPQRIENDKYFNDNWGDVVKTIPNTDGEIYSILNSYISESSTPLKIAIDISSMSRIWYSSVINYFNHCDYQHPVYLDMFYSVGEHQDPVAPIQTDEIMCLPGYEGAGFSLDRAVAFFGLGFDGFSPLCVFDQLEPDQAFAFMADPAAFDDYPQITYDINKELIENYISESRLLRLPLNNVEESFYKLSEAVSPFLDNSRIIFVPLGPKPHILASILLSLRYPEIACLHVSGKKKKPERVAATGVISSTRVNFE